MGGAVYKTGARCGAVIKARARTKVITTATISASEQSRMYKRKRPRQWHGSVAKSTNNESVSVAAAEGRQWGPAGSAALTNQVPLKRAENGEGGEQVRTRTQRVQRYGRHQNGNGINQRTELVENQRNRRKKRGRPVASVAAQRARKHNNNSQSGIEQS